jgi:uncharacterized OsmC-like protein
MPGPMTIEAATEDQVYSAFHMLASGLAFCTYSVLASWASNAKLRSDDIVIDMHWTFVEDPHRLGKIEMKIEWPSLPPQRQTAAQRVANMCAIHATLERPPELSTTVIAAGTALAAS